MNKTLFVLAVLLVLPAAVHGQDKAGTTAATFLGIGADARGMAMGNAQVAVADGPSALYWNPSGIVETSGTSVAFSTTSWLVDSRLSYVGAVVDAGGLGQFGLSVLALDFGEMEVTNEENPDGTGELFTPLSFAAGVTYAKALTDRFAIGGTVKFVQERIWNERASGAALDLGVRYTTPFRGLRIGMTLTNFGSNMQLDGKDLYEPIDRNGQSGDNPNLPGRLETDSWALPLAFRVGVSIDAFETASQRLVVSADALAPSDNAQSASFGGEYSFRELFYVRGGYRQAFAADLDDQGWALGFGLRYAFGNLGLHADYSFREQQPFGTPQTLSIGASF